jgi:hypothetical protein
MLPKLQFNTFQDVQAAVHPFGAAIYFGMELSCSEAYVSASQCR